jgi:N6-adenosine-specific RNA methylase IME4
MGRYFRGCSEQCLIGTRGKVSKLVQSKSERNVILAPKMPHSQKPEQLQSALERMLPGPYLEMFARRKRKGWTTVGLEVGSGHDLRTWKPSRVK